MSRKRFRRFTCSNTHDKALVLGVRCIEPAFSSRNQDLPQAGERGNRGRL